MLASLRTRAVLLALLWLAAVARGLFWAVQTEVPSPVDEGQHLAVVHHIADTASLPVVGRDRIDADALLLIKSNETGVARAAPLPPHPYDPGWGAVAQMYQAHHPPLAYLALAPVRAALGDHVSLVTALYAMRMVLVLIASAAVPLAYLLARELAPGVPGAHLGAAGLVAVAQAAAANTVAVSNDGVVMTVSALALVLGVRGLRRGATGAITAGVVLGLAGLTKVTAVSTGLMLALAAGLAAGGGLTWRRAGLWTLTVAGTALAVVVPWVVWNLVTYDGRLGSQATFELLAPDGDRQDVGRIVAFQLREATVAFWEGTLVPESVRAGYRAAWWALVGLALLAAAAGIAKRRVAAWGWCVWALAAWPIAALVQVVAVLSATQGAPVAGGRLLLTALVPTAVGVAVAAGLVARRAGPTVLAVAAAGLLILEVPLLAAMPEVRYSRGLVDGMAPVVEQTWGERLHPGPADIVVADSCPVEVLTLALRPDPPLQLVARDADGRVVLTARPNPAARLGGVVHAIYDPARPLVPPARIMLPTDSHVAVALDFDETGPVTIDEAGVSPVVGLHCGGPAPERARYDGLRGATNRLWPPFGFARAWGWSWAATGVLAAAAVVVVPARRRDSTEDSSSPRVDR